MTQEPTARVFSTFKALVTINRDVDESNASESNPLMAKSRDQSTTQTRKSAFQGVSHLYLWLNLVLCIAHSGIAIWLFVESSAKVQSDVYLYDPQQFWNPCTFQLEPFPSLSLYPPSDQQHGHQHEYTFQRPQTTCSGCEWVNQTCQLTSILEAHDAVTEPNQLYADLAQAGLRPAGGYARTGGSFNIILLQGWILLITALFHCVYTFLAWCAKDSKEGTDSHKDASMFAVLGRHYIYGYHWLRWLEYAITAPLVLISAAVVLGLNNLYAVWFLALHSSATILFGLCIDLVGFWAAKTDEAKKEKAASSLSSSGKTSIAGMASKGSAKQDKVEPPTMRRDVPKWGRVALQLLISVAFVQVAAAWGVLSWLFQTIVDSSGQEPPGFVGAIVGLEFTFFLLFGVACLFSWSPSLLYACATPEYIRKWCCKSCCLRVCLCCKSCSFRESFAFPETIAAEILFVWLSAAAKLSLAFIAAVGIFVDQDPDMCKQVLV